MSCYQEKRLTDRQKDNANFIEPSIFGGPKSIKNSANPDEYLQKYHFGKYE